MPDKGSLEQSKKPIDLKKHWEMLMNLDGKHIRHSKDFTFWDRDILVGWVIDGSVKQEIIERIVVPGYPLRPGGKKSSLIYKWNKSQIEEVKRNIGCDCVLPFLQPAGNGHKRWIQGYILLEDLFTPSDEIDTLLMQADVAWVANDSQLHESKICTYVAMTNDTEKFDDFYVPPTIYPQFVI